ncbi:unnamed protein product [Symbiodinium sp. CCMP2592]|nr:unnamed protein product [Symbiodinium sp. CCMP2592]
MFSAMNRSAQNGEEPPAKKKRILPPIGKEADEEKHVFISVEGYAEQIEKLFEGDHEFVFIRGGVAIGKTTLAEHLGRSEKYVKVPFTEHGRDDAWRVSTVEAVQQATGKVDRAGSAFRSALKQAKDNNLTLIYDEAHTLFLSPDLCSDLFKADIHYRPRVLLFSASGDASSTSSLAMTTPREISRKVMWTPPLPCTLDLKEQLKEAGVKLDKESIEFFTSFCGGHRGIFIAAMHWVKSKQNPADSWNFRKTVGYVRNSYKQGNWNCADTELLGFVQQSRAVRINGRFHDVERIPREFVELLCKGATSIAEADVRRELSINGFVVPKPDRGIEAEFQSLDWNNAHTEYQVANPLLASYYRFILQKQCALEVGKGIEVNPRHCADLLMRALPYMLFCKVVSFEGDESELATDGLPHEQQYNKAAHSVLHDMGYRTFAPEASGTGKGKPDLKVQIGTTTFIIEGAKGKIPEHLERFQNFENYKNAEHKGLYIISNNNEKMLETVRKTSEGDVQIIGLVPNIAHTAYTVHVKSKGIKSINTFTVDCDLVARRLVLKDDGEPELYSVQSLKSVNLSPKAQSSKTSEPVVWVRELALKDGTVAAKSRQEEELERAFKVQSREGAQLNDVDDLATAIKQMNPDLRDIAPRHIDIYLYSKEAGAWQRVASASTSLRQDTSELDCYGFLPWQRT